MAKPPAKPKPVEPKPSLADQIYPHLIPNRKGQR
jgi:hypothetical protein